MEASVPNDLTTLCDTLRARGFRVEPDPYLGTPDANARAVSAGEGSFVLVWMPDGETIANARVMGDFPTYVSSWAVLEELEEMAHNFWCGGLYHFLRVFVDGADVSTNYRLHLRLPEDATAPASG